VVELSCKILISNCKIVHNSILYTIEQHIIRIKSSFLPSYSNTYFLLLVVGCLHVHGMADLGSTKKQQGSKYICVFAVKGMNERVGALRA
jgi:hypothetical protein